MNFEININCWHKCEHFLPLRCLLRYEGVILCATGKKYYQGLRHAYFNSGNHTALLFANVYLACNFKGIQGMQIPWVKQFQMTALNQLTDLDPVTLYGSTHHRARWMVNRLFFCA